MKTTLREEMLKLFIIVSIVAGAFLFPKKSRQLDDSEVKMEYEKDRKCKSWFGYMASGASREQMWWQTLILEGGRVRMVVFTLADGSERGPDQFSTKPNGQGVSLVRGRPFSVPAENVLCIVELARGLTEITVDGDFSRDEWHSLCKPSIWPCRTTNWWPA